MTGFGGAALERVGDMDCPTMPEGRRRMVAGLGLSCRSMMGGLEGKGGSFLDSSGDDGEEVEFLRAGELGRGDAVSLRTDASVSLRSLGEG